MSFISVLSNNQQLICILLPMHCPSINSKPSEQGLAVQVKEPRLLVQISLLAHGYGSFLHSLMSVDWFKLVVRTYIIFFFFPITVTLNLAIHSNNFFICLESKNITDIWIIKRINYTKFIFRKPSHSNSRNCNIKPRVRRLKSNTATLLLDIFIQTVYV